MPPPAEGSSEAYTISQWYYNIHTGIHMWVVDVRNQSLTNVYFQIYMDIYVCIS